jgi:methionyl-tRNA formyltransferase
MSRGRTVLLLSPYPEKLLEPIKAAGDCIKVSNDDWRTISGKEDFDFIVSYGYRHIIKDPFLAKYAGRILNLHISYLPWGRGADPNFWAWRDDEPHGVTLHLVDAGVDTGPIIRRRLVSMSPTDTLSTSYAKLRQAAEELFAQEWPMIEWGIGGAVPQPNGGSHHFAREAKPLISVLPLGYDTKCKLIQKSIQLTAAAAR